MSTLPELRAAVQEDNQTIVMRSGRYSLTDLPDDARDLPCSGSNNTIELVGVSVTTPVGATRRGYIKISGDNNVFRGGVFEDVYQNGLEEVTDFSAYNQDRSRLAKGLGGDAVLAITGDNNLIAGTKLIVRGSFPYGYGSIYGIGAENAFGLDKRCGILVKGESNIIDGCEVQQRAFGHGIYMQSPADRTVVRNTLVEGVLRPSNELYLETNPRDLPARSNYEIPPSRASRRRGRGRGRNRDENRGREAGREEVAGTPIPRDTMIPLAEDGIRVYTRGGSVTVENCTVKKMRGGIRLYMASRATVINSTAIDCGDTNFNLPSDGRIVGSSGNFAYAPLSDFRLSRSRQKIELTILPSTQSIGTHNLADILGDEHNIIFHRADGPPDAKLRAIVIHGSGSTIKNETHYPMTLLPTANRNTVESCGPVTDLGSGNEVSRIELPVSKTDTPSPPNQG
ncbi:protein-transmembrane prediction [Pirellulimonas nuda]|uniref:protein-transmembrane prediction n=1 Tax=Pirellulimonas nuda TaxID=2528009 RepID=UPI00119F4B37|nr:protein-transmembrane prediction [Pirellulimonas nuda]